MSTGTPEGFDQLASSRVVFVDVYFGDRKIAESFAVTRPGLLRFRSPGNLLSRVPDLVMAPEITSALAGDLPTNSNAVCSQTNAKSCGVINPEVVGIIYDEDRFRVDLFVNPRFLRTSHAQGDTYLPIPSTSLSLTNALGLNASGTFGGSSAYNFQNRTIIGLHNARIRANTSIASDLGLVVDDLVGEVDKRDLRYSAGMFWAPGNDFIGQRRIIGAGVGTQFDTWADQGQLHGTPLVVFLAQPARVEILADGRLVSSRAYAPGNIELDTSDLPEGSYPVLLRIRQSNGAVREEQRFFVKNAQVPPSGHPMFFAYAGVLANTQRHRAISPSSTLYYQAGTAWRLTNNFAFDIGAVGTQHKVIAQAGAWFIQRSVRIRAAGLYSSAGDWGALLQASTAGHGPLNISFDLRRIWSRDGKPLIPLPSYANTFDLTPPTGVQLAVGSYTQATASIGLQLGPGYLSVIGSYRKDRHFPADYAIGPSINWPIVSRRQLQVVFEASAQRTRTATSAFAGFRVLFNSGRLSMFSSVGRGYQSDQGSGEAAISRAVSTLTAQYSYQTENSNLNLGGGFDRNISSSTVHAAGNYEGRLGNLRADLLHNLEGQRGTQYDVAFQSGLALGAHGADLGGRDLQQSAIAISVNGDASSAAFKVMVNDVARGQVRTGRRLLIFVPPYRRYKVRIVPVAAVPVDFDTATREITLYPGNVQALEWKAQSYFTVFGQAVSRAGAPIADALVQSAKGIAHTDSNGYFQLDVRRDDPITVAKGETPSCQIRLGNVAVRNDFASVGKVVCE
ncbi:MAG: TcfC E-set like domain-containing protein [Sphingomicrobium sp.]